MLTTKYGSSPRVRGRLCASLTGEIGGGLIPADAGQTAGWYPRMGLLAAHPRGCGAD